MNTNEMFEQFVQEDIRENHGLIINSLKEIRCIMSNPAEHKCFTEGYLDNLLFFATHQSEFYKKYQNYKSIKDFPILTKAQLRENYDSIMVDLFKGKSNNCIRRTSGSTGTPFELVWDHRKHSRFVATMKYYAEICGCASHERIVCLIVKNALAKTPLEKQKKDNVFTLQLTYLDDDSISDIFKQLEGLNPKAIIGYSSIFDAFANYIYDGKANGFSIHPSVIFSEAGELTDRTKKILNDYFGCHSFSRYGNEESGILAQEDGTGNGFRVNSGSLYFEILKLDSDEDASDGEVGRVVVTDLFNYAFPLIRYDIGDLAAIRTLSDGKQYITNLVGRKEDVLYTTDGKIVVQELIKCFLKKYMDIKQFQIIQEDETHYHWLLNTNNKSYEDEITNKSKEILGQDAVVSIEYVNSIPCMRTGKYKIVICKLKR